MLFYPAFCTSNKEATTCNLFAVPAVTFNMSSATKISSLLIKSIVPLADTALSLYILKTSLPFVTVRVIVSAYHYLLIQE